MTHGASGPFTRASVPSESWKAKPSETSEQEPLRKESHGLTRHGGTILPSEVGPMVEEGTKKL